MLGTLSWLLSQHPIVPIDAQQPAPNPQTVHLVIDFGDGTQRHFTQIAWHTGMTVLDALQAAARHPRGIRIAHRGSQATAFVYMIDDLANDPSGGRGWRYRVNDKLADRSCGIYQLDAGASIRWTFE
jgi:hypothetical protein